MIDQELLKILACPDCKSDVVLKDNKLQCTKCQRRYPIKDGIPIMIIDESESLPKEENNEKDSSNSRT